MHSSETELQQQFKKSPNDEEHFSYKLTVLIGGTLFFRFWHTHSGFYQRSTEFCCLFSSAMLRLILLELITFTQIFAYKFDVLFSSFWISFKTTVLKIPEFVGWKDWYKKLKKDLSVTFKEPWIVLNFSEIQFNFLFNLNWLTLFELLHTFSKFYLMILIYIAKIWHKNSWFLLSRNG